MSEHDPGSQGEQQENSIQPATPSVSARQAEIQARIRPQLAQYQQTKRPEDHPVVQEVVHLFQVAVAPASQPLASEKHAREHGPSANLRWRQP